MKGLHDIFGSFSAIYISLTILALQFLVVCRAGHIYPWDLEMNYINAGFASIFTIPFKLENGISASDYLKFVFPFKLHTQEQYGTANGDIPVNLIASYAPAVGDYKCGNGDSNLALININVVSGINQESTSYYISFFDVLGNRVALTANQYYYLKIELTGSNVNIQSPGIKVPLQVYSVSSISSYAIIYDRNPSFGNIALGDYPLTEMLLTVAFESEDSSNLMDTVNTVYVDVGIKQTILDSARIEIRFLNNDFTFTSDCSTGNQNSNPYIPVLPTSQYTCAYNSNDNTVTYTIHRTVNANEMFRFIVNVHNPAYVSQQGQIQVRTLYLHQNNIIELQNSESVFNIKQITFDSQNMQLGWGLEYSSSAINFYPFNLQVMRQSATTPDFIPYNAFSWVFKISKDLPDSIKVQVEIQVPNKLKTFILPGSISNTLPSYTGLSVYCYLSTLVDPTQAKIICKNVGKMFSSVEYRIGCRITFPYDPFTSPLEPNFGMLTLFSVDITTDVYQGMALSESRNPLSIVSTDNNPSWAQNSNNLDYTLFSTASLADTVNSANLNTLGAVPQSSSTTLQQFVFTMQIVTTTITNTVGNLSTGAGLVILANPNVISLQSSDSPTIETSNDSGLINDINLFTSVQISERASYLKIKITAFHSADLTLLVNGACPNCFFKIKRGRVTRHSSFYADQYLLDFYIATFDQINSSNPVLKNVFLYNAYTINTGGPSNIRYGVSNYLTAAALQMDGSTAPVIFRIAGYFNPSDLGSSRSKIAIFFKNLEPFYEDSQSNYNTEIPCFSTITTSYTCNFFTSGTTGGIASGQSYANYHRIEIDFEKIPTGASEKFQLIIPMKSFVNKQNDIVSIYLGGLQQSSIYSSNSNLNSITTLYRLTGKNNIAFNKLFPSILAVVPANLIANSGSYDWTLATGSRVGLVNSNLSFKVGNAGTAGAVTKNDQNTPEKNGASFTLCSEWNYLTTSSTITFALGSSEATGSCLSFQYAYTFTGTTPNYRYGIYCPFEQGTISTATVLKISNAFLPYINGVLPPSQNMVAWSNNEGILAQYKLGTAGYTSMTVGSIIVSPVVRKLTVGRSKEYFSVIFTTQNPIISGNQITLTFNSAGAFTDFTLQTVTNPCKISEASVGELQATCTTAIVSASKVLNVVITNCSNCLTSGGSTYTLTLYGILMGNPAILPAIKFGLILYAKTPIAANLIVDQSATINNEQPLTYINSSTATDPVIDIQSLYMGCKNKRCRSQMHFTITFTRRIVAVDEQFVLSLGGYARDNSVYQSNLICKIQQPIVAPSTTSSPSFDWKSMDTTLLNQITIIPKKEIPEDTVILFYCDGIRTPYSINPTQINGFVSPQGQISSIFSGFMDSLEYSQIQSQILFPSSNLLIQYKEHNTVGSSVEFNFNITSSKINVISTTFIVINFPTTYSPQLTSNYIYCLMNKVFVDCKIVSSYTILITSLPFNVDKNNFFNIQIFGVEQSGLFFDSYMSILVGLSNQVTYDILDEFGDVNDIESSTVPQRIFITRMDITNNYIRSTADYSFKVRIPAGSIVKGNYVYIDFPKVWDRIINYISPLCFVYNPSNTTDFSSDCKTFGNRITIPIDQTDGNANNFYYIVIENLRNPDLEACQANRMRISVSQDNGSTIASRSGSSLWNIVGLPFKKNPSQINLKWVDATTNLEVSQASAYIGIFNNQVTLGSDYGAFVKAFYVTTPNNQFYVDPSKPKATLGYPTSQFQIAANRTTTQGLFLVQMQKSDDQGAQTDLPFLKVQVIQQKFSINIQDLVFYIPFAGHSLPILIDMVDCKSIYDTLFSATLFDPTTPLVSAAGLSFVNRSNIILNYNNPRGFLMVQANENSVNPAGTGEIRLVLSDQALQFYNALPLITYQVVPNKSVAPQAKLSLSAVAKDKGATYLKVQVECNQDSTFYYIASIDGSKTMNHADVIQKAWVYTDSNILTDPYNYHYGFTNIYVALVDENVVFNNKLLQINKLKPSTNYNITGFCVNGNDKISTSQTIMVTTKGNSGIFLSISFTFSQIIQSDMAKQFACFLTSYLKIPAPYLRTQFNEYCDLDSRRRILDYYVGYQDPSYSYGLEDNNGMNIQRILDSASTSTTTYISKMYIYPISEFEKDSITPQIQINGIDTTELITYAYGNITGLPSITAIGQPTLGEYIPPLFVNQTDITPNTGLNFANITGLQCDKYCIIYVMIDLQTKPAPTYYDIRTGYNGQKNENSTFTSNSTIFTKTSQFFYFENLQKNTKYSFYYYAAADDPSISQPRTKVYSLTFSTEEQETENSTRLHSNIILLIILLIMIFV